MSDDDKAAWLGKLGVTTVGGGAQAAGQDALPTIWVTAKGDGSFTVMGVAFNPNADVKLRVVDDAGHKLDFDLSADPAGKFTFGTGKVCKQEGAIHFSATDSRPTKRGDLTGVDWSNTATSSCPSGGGDGKGGDGGDGGGGDGGGGGGGDGGGGGGGDGGGGGGGDGGGGDGGGGDGGGGDGNSGGDGGDGSS
jgi:hypothetical protein